MERKDFIPLSVAAFLLGMVATLYLGIGSSFGIVIVALIVRWGIKRRRKCT